MSKVKSDLVQNRDDLHSAITNVDMSMTALAEIGDILRAIEKLSVDHDVICRLAKVGVRLQDRHYDLFDSEYERLSQKLMIANGGSNV